MKRGLGAVGVVVALFLLPSCSGTSTPRETSSASAAPSPVFRSKDDALDQSKGLYEKFLQVTDQLAEDDSPDFNSLRKIASEALVQEERKGVEEVDNAGLASKGRSRLVAFTLQRADLVTGRTTAYACVDLSNVKVIKDGHVVRAARRPDRQTSEVQFRIRGTRLIVEQDGEWSGDSIC